jgi:hypothetical protein
MIGMKIEWMEGVGRVGLRLAALACRDWKLPWGQLISFESSSWTYHRPNSDLSSFIFSLEATLKLLLLLLVDSLGVFRYSYHQLQNRDIRADSRARVESPAGLDTFCLCDPSSKARRKIELAKRGSSGGFEEGAALVYSRQLFHYTCPIDVPRSIYPHLPLQYALSADVPLH